MNGRPEKGMPPFSASKMVTDNWEGLYAYPEGSIRWKDQARATSTRWTPASSDYTRRGVLLLIAAMLLASLAFAAGAPGGASPSRCARIRTTCRSRIASGAGYENKIAEALARDLGRKVAVHLVSPASGLRAPDAARRRMTPRTSSSATSSSACPRVTSSRRRRGRTCVDLRARGAGEERVPEPASARTICWHCRLKS